MNLLIKFVIFLSCVVSVSAVDCGIADPCQNSGTCNVGTCACSQGFTGDLCEITISFDFNADAELPENQGTYTITVSRVEINYALSLTITVGGTASSSDFSLSTTSLTFASGDTDKLVTLTIIDDAFPEPDETIVITMTHTDGTDVSRTYTISKNDPLLIHTTFSDNVREGGADITLSGTNFIYVGGTPSPTPVPITVTVTSVSGAVLNTDYRVSEASSSLSFSYDHDNPTPTTTALNAFTISFPQDTTAEVQKKIKVEFTSEYLLSGSTSTTITIDDDDGIVISTAGISATMVEGGSFDLSSTVFQYVPPGTPTPITMTVKVASGSAVLGTDFSTSEATGELTFTYDSTSAASRASLDGFTITATEDGDIESDKTFTFTFESDYDIIDGRSRTITIQDNDPETITLTGPDSVNENDGTATYTLTRTSTVRAVTVSYTIRAAAIDTALYNTNVQEETSTVDFAAGETSKTFPVTLNDDSVVQIAKSFTISAEGTLVVAIPDKVVNIVEDDKYEVTFTGVTVSEGDVAILTFTRDASAGTLSITVTTADATATAGADYTAQSSTSVTFNNGETSKTLSIPTSEDTTYEDTETFTVTMTSAATLKPTSTTSPVTITITDNDVEVLKIADKSVNENDGSVTLTITRTATFEALAVTAGTQIPTGASFPITSSDITERTGVTVNFAVGSASATFEVTITDDAIVEADETFDVVIDAPDPISDVSATVTIVNNDAYTLSFSEPTVTEGDTASITITRDVTTGPLTFTVNTADGTAASGSDYTAMSAQVLTFGDGSDAVTLTISTTDDDVHEAEESFTFSFTSSQPITGGPGTVTITDNDPEVLTLSGPGTIAENAGPVTITITRTGTFEAITVTASTVIPSSGTPITADDITMQTSVSISFPVGTASKDFVVAISNDELFERNEDFEVQVTGTSISTVTKTVTITNDDDYQVTFSDATVNEGETLSLTFTRDSSIGPLTVPVSTTDGTAVDSSDYTALGSANVVFSDGSTTASVDIFTMDDPIYEGDETFTVSIVTTDLKASSTSSATITIDDDDVDVLTLSGPGAIAENAGSVTITITRTTTFEAITVTASTVIPSSGTPITADDITMQSSASINFPIGTASKDFVVAISNDELFELEEEFIVRVTAPGLAQKEKTVTIENDDMYEVTFSDVTVSEGEDATIQFTRDSSVGALNIPFSTTDGTATSPGDYTAQSSSITFADGESSKDIVIPTIANTLFENDETFTVSITPAVTLKGSSTSSATVTITNDDSYQVDFSDDSVNEGNTIVVTFMRDSDVGELTLLVTTTDGTATASSDYTAVSSVPVMFSNGEVSATINLITTEDTIYEQDETLTMSITSTSPLTASSQTPKTFTIINDDVEVITITGGGGVQENAGTVTLTISRTGTFETLDVTVGTEIPSSGTPISSSDIVERSNVPLTFAVGSSSVTFTVDINDDNLFEFDEDFLVKVDATPNSIVDKEATVTIQNDDMYEVTFSAASVTEGVDLTVTFTRDSSIGPLSIAVSTADGTANAGSDYTALSASSVQFSNGDSSVSLTISITDDNVYEPSESFDVSITSQETLKPSSTTSETFMINDNDVEVLTITGNTNVNEEDGTVTLMINRQGDFEVLVVTASTLIPSGEQYPISASGDIVMQSAVSITFPIGTTSMEFTVTISNDDVAEADEKFAVEVTAPSPIATVTELVTILNNDPDTVTFEPFLALYEDGAQKFVKITRTVDDKEVTVQVNSQDDTATGGVDYNTLSNLPVTFAVGSLETTFPVQVINDALDEADERLTLVVSGATVKTTDPKVFIIVDNEGSRPFDCRRRGQSCANAADICTSDVPLCQCVGSPSREGDSCNIVTDQKNGAACVSNNVQCNGGVCVDNAGATSCKCYPGYYGDSCQHYFLQAVCTADSMTLVANPEGNFQGKIYVQEKLDVADCTANPVPSPPVQNDNIDDNLMGWALTVDHNSATCDSISPQENTTHIFYERKVIIQYNDDVTTGVDQIATISCTVPKNNFLVHAGTITVDRNLPLVEEGATNPFSPLTVGVDKSGVPVPDLTTVGISEKLCVTLRIPSAFGGLEIVDIEFNNTMTAVEDQKSWRVFTAGCPVGDVKAVLVDVPFYPTGNKREIKFCFAAFKFTNSFRLTVQVAVKICINSADCSLKSCATSRRKRQTGQTSEKTVDATFIIRDPSLQETLRQNSSTGVTVVSTNDQCSLSNQFIPTVVSLGVLVFLLVLLCLFLTYLLTRRSRKYDDKEEPEPQPLPTKIIPQWLVFRR